MKRKRYTEEQIIGFLKAHDHSEKVDEFLLVVQSADKNKIGTRDNITDKADKAHKAAQTHTSRVVGVKGYAHVNDEAPRLLAIPH